MCISSINNKRLLFNFNQQRLPLTEGGLPVQEVYCRFEIRRTLRAAKDERQLLSCLTTVRHFLFLRPHHSWIHGDFVLDLKPENGGGNLFSFDAAFDG